MPLSYKIVLGSVALLCLVVIGFKAVSTGGAGDPEPIAASQVNAKSAGDALPGLVSETTLPADTSAQDSNGANGSTESVDPPSTDGSGPDPVQTSAGTNESIEQSIADATRELATPSNSEQAGGDSVTHAAPENIVATTTQLADSSSDSEDKGLDDLLSRIRKYEEDVLGDEDPSGVATTNVAESTDINAFSDDNTNAKSSDVATEGNTDLASNDAASTDDAIVIPDVPPVVTIGAAAPIVSAETDSIDNATPTVDSDVVVTTGDSADVDLPGKTIVNEPHLPESNHSDVTAEQSSVELKSPMPPTPVVIPIAPKPVDNELAAGNREGNANSRSTYTVKPGDTFSSIAVTVFGAERHWLAIANANPKVDSRRLRVGQVLQMPDPNRTATADSSSSNSSTNKTVPTPPQPAPTVAKGTHVVRAGETLWGIAKEHYGKGELWHHVYKVNRDVIGSKPGNVRAGMKLRIAALPPTRP